MRIVLSSLGLVGILVAPVWVPALLAIILSLRFRAWEVPVLGLLTDFLWLPQVAGHAVPVATIAAVVLVWAFEPVRREFLLSSR